MPYAHVLFSCYPHNSTPDGRAAKIVSELSRSPINHVAVADDMMVLDVRLRRTAFYPYDLYVIRNPYLAYIVDIHVENPVVFPSFEGVGKVNVLGSFKNWKKRPGDSAWNCFTASSLCLIDSGVSIADNILTPDDLFWALKESGYLVRAVPTRQAPVPNSRDRRASPTRRDRRGQVRTADHP